jgi:hypothetical protein
MRAETYIRKDGAWLINRVPSTYERFGAAVCSS